MFPQNVGGIDKIARIVVGLLAIVFALLGPAELTWKWGGFIGVVPLLTGLLGFCPLYPLIGLSTCPKK